MKAIFNNVVIAESMETIVLEGNHYFPIESLQMQYCIKSDHESYCPWKGIANYYHVLVNGIQGNNSVWFYDNPSEAASKIKGRVAFWKGVKITE